MDRTKHWGNRIGRVLMLAAGLLLLAAAAWAGPGMALLGKYHWVH